MSPQVAQRLWGNAKDKDSAGVDNERVRHGMPAATVSAMHISLPQQLATATRRSSEVHATKANTPRLRTAYESNHHANHIWSKAR